MASTRAHGTLLKVGDAASPEVFTTVAYNVTITGPELINETIDVTNHDSASNHRERIAGLQDAGPITGTLNYDPLAATHKNAAGGVLKDYIDQTDRNWQLVFPSSPTVTWSITGIMTSFVPTAPIDDKLTATFAIQPTAKPTLV